MTNYPAMPVFEKTTRGNYQRSVYGQIQWMGRHCRPRAIEKWTRREIRRLGRHFIGFEALMAPHIHST